MRWLLTYADMITLLMAFFIMMYSMSVLNLAKFNEVAFSIRSGFGGILSGSGAHIMQTQANQRNRQASRLTSAEVAIDKAHKQVKATLNKLGLSHQVEVKRDTRGLVVTIATDGLLFPIGSAELTPQAHQSLDVVSAVIHAMANPVVVEGHTCTKRIANTRFPSNWELSAARASRVVRYLINQGIAPERLAAVGYGETHPVMPNDTEEHQQKNRRVDIVILEHSQSPQVTDTTAETPVAIRAEIHHSIHSSFNRVWSSMRNEGSTP